MQYKIKTEEQNWGPYKLSPNSRAMLRLSTGTATAVATGLLIPDLFAMLPSATDPLSFVLRALGLWGYAFVLWMTGFLGLLHIVRICSEPLILDSQGIKLGRLEKKIPWTAIDAVSVQERRIFSRVFFTDTYQMSIHLRDHNNKMQSKQIASFLYLTDEFYSLFRWIALLSNGTEPASLKASVFQNNGYAELKKHAEEGRLKRAALATLIAFSLFSYLGRKAAVNYCCNLGNREYFQANYEKAAECYARASAIDFCFAPAWDHLARAEFHTGDLDSAEEHWRTALQWKPDFVDSKLGLSTVLMRRGKLDEAEALIDRSIGLAPFDEAPRISKAHIETLRGRYKQAISQLEPMLSSVKSKELCLCMLARCYIREGNLDEAGKLLSSYYSLINGPINQAYCSSVIAEFNLSENNIEEARKLLKTVRKEACNNPEILVDMARCETAAGNLAQAESYIKAAAKIWTDYPWLAIARAELCKKSGEKGAAEKSRVWISRALSSGHEDPSILAVCAEILDSDKEKQRSLELAKNALSLDPDNLIAKKIYLAGKEALSHD